MKKLLVALALTLSVTGCVFTRESSEWMKSYGKTFYEPDSGMAAVYIIRGVPDEDTSPLRVVIGQQPVLEPGESFEYTSGTPLETPSGFMVGLYHMVATTSGETFDAAIPAFSLDSPHHDGRLH